MQGVVNIFVSMLKRGDSFYMIGMFRYDGY